ncbi:unnamed protein product [Caenorhabditis auriculariae]|uniref:Uncharacterized protein n=1 Tax=Caenorhabditis auriculariae TaxID=2777116 RepID=A0A8S1HES0_9PELO|nr:unnamed protein product [Caenorhabditis auriculariae]
MVPYPVGHLALHSRLIQQVILRKCKSIGLGPPVHTAEALGRATLPDPAVRPSPPLLPSGVVGKRHCERAGGCRRKNERDAKDCAVWAQ